MDTNIVIVLVVSVIAIIEKILLYKNDKTCSPYCKKCRVSFLLLFFSLREQNFQICPCTLFSQFKCLSLFSSMFL